MGRLIKGPWAFGVTDDVIGVDPNESGQGIGKAVCTEGLIYLKEKGIKQAMLYVDDDNEAGKGLYKTLGFN